MKDFILLKYGSYGESQRLGLIIDTDGNIRGGLETGNYFQNILINKNKNFVWAKNNKIYEYNIFGKLIKVIGTKNYNAHHDIYEKSDGNYLITVSKKGSILERKNEKILTIEDYIIEIDKSGNIIKEWDFKKLIKLNDYIAPELYETYNFKGNKKAAIHDWAHANAFAYDKKDCSIVVSFRHLNAVIKFEYETGEILWIFADPKNPWLTEELKAKLLKVKNKNIYVYGQHAVKVLEDGNILLYDNGNYRDLYSRGIVTSSDDYNPTNNKTRAIEFKVQNQTAELVWEYVAQDIYTPFVGDVNKLEENHYFISFGGIVEVDGKLDDDILGVMVFGTTEGKLYGKMIEVKDGKIVFLAKTHGKKDSTVYRGDRINFK